ncbi:MAG TPA: SdrD B-like domain-containing protein, partial [Vicinamibacterales bacterium]|nr:SdrD B-like domain-containing protein [Vicinamibacterales bacterium]
MSLSNSLVTRVAKAAGLMLGLVLLGVLDGRVLRADPVIDEKSVVCFPSCDVNDGRMFTISATTSAMSPKTAYFGLGSAPGSVDFNFGIFDPDSGYASGSPAFQHWDGANFAPTLIQLRYDLYADPLGDGSGAVGKDLIGTGAVVSIQGAALGAYDNKWYDRTVTNVPAAQRPDGSYRYVLRVTIDSGTASSSTFKVRSTGLLYLNPGQPFSFQPYGLTNDHLNIMQHVYDGTWNFPFIVPDPGANMAVGEVAVWDGDTDYGIPKDAFGNCPNPTVNQDTDDPDTTGTYPPGVTSADSVAARAETVASSSSSSLTQTCPTSSPTEDNSGSMAASLTKTVSPAGALAGMQGVGYTLIAPDGTPFVNKNPSGNLEWEQFRVKRSSVAGAADYSVPHLYPGVYQLKIEGVDINNVNAFYLDKKTIGLPPTGDPPPEDDAYYYINRFVFADANGDGRKQTGELGISGATVDLLRVSTITALSSDGAGVATATTSDAHKLFAGSQVTIRGAVPSAFNGAVTVTSVIDSTTFTYATAAVIPQGAASGDMSVASFYATRVTDAQGEFSFRVGKGQFEVLVDKPNSPILAALFPTTPELFSNLHLGPTPAGGCAAGAAPGSLDCPAPEVRRDFGYVAQPAAVKLIKKTNNVDYPVSSPVVVATGSTVTWTYQITNTGGMALTFPDRNAVNQPLITALLDDKIGNVQCPVPVLYQDSGFDPVYGLGIGQSMTCTATGAAIAGLYENTGCVRAVSVGGHVVDSCEVDRYYASSAAISLIKHTNDTDNNVVPGLALMVGDQVKWTYFISNTGDVPLDITLVDDKLGVITNSCPGAPNSVRTLAPGASMTCQVLGTAAIAGQYSNIGTVTGKPQLGPSVHASDPDNYFAHQPASLSGFVYVDANNNGVKEGGETPIPNVTVSLAGTDMNGAPVNRATTTDAAGLYSFTNLVPGTYTVSELQPAGYVDGKDTQGTPGNGGTATNDAFMNITLAGGVNGTDNNFGELNTSSLAGFVYVDANDDGVKDAGEQGIGNATVTLSGTDDLGAPVSATTLTAANGAWSFSALRPGVYTVTETQPTGYLDGKDTQGTPGTGSTTNDQFAAIVLGAGVHGSANNFGELLPATIGDRVWLDINGNGRQDEGESGIPGVSVMLLGAIGPTPLQTTISGAAGEYEFKVRPGTYRVRFVLPAGAYDTTTTPDQGADAGDSDADAMGGTGQYVVASGETNLTVDGGLLPIDLSINKTVDNNTPSIGSNVVFTLTVANAGGFSTATGVTVTDVLPAGLNFVSAAATQGSFSGSTWTVGTLAAGNSATLTLAANVATGGIKRNFTQVQTASQIDVDSKPGNQPPDGTPTEDDEDDVMITPPAVIGDYVWLDKNINGQQDAGEPGLAGVVVTLMDAAGATVLDTTVTDLAGKYQFVVAPGNYRLRFVTPSGTYDAWTLLDSGPDAADSDFNGQLTGVYTVAAGDSNLTIDGGLKPIDLSVTKAVDVNVPQVGSDVLFTITVSNAAGMSTATGVTLSDVLPAGLTFVSASASQGSFSGSTWTVGTVAPGDTKTLSITATMATSGNKTNFVQVWTANQFDIDSTPGDKPVSGPPSDDDEAQVVVMGAMPKINIIKKTNGTDNNVAPGVLVAVPSTVTWTYTVNNTGNVALSNVVVTDDAGTPGNTADDFAATYVSGDTDDDGRLDTNETWLFTAAGTAAAGQYTNLGTVIGKPPAGPDVTDNDPDNYYGQTPSISIIKTTNGTDNNSGTGPVVAVPSLVTWGYTVKNTGNIAVGNVVVTDDAGTTANPADDFTATYQSGDTNTDGKLDVTETWQFSATGTATAGQYINNGCVVGHPPVGVAVSACDPDRYYGETPKVAIVKKTNGTDHPTGPGPIVAVGSVVTWTYEVTNAGNVAVSNVAVKDDNGTPADSTDDFAVTVFSGDTNNDGKLDLTETWTYTASRPAIAGAYKNDACVVGVGPAGTATNTACDPDYYYGETPKVAIVKKTNGSDNNAAPGLFVAVGTPMTWTYEVTNTGDVALASLNVTDDKGVAVSCPSTSLAVGASMVCTGTGVATAGAYVNNGCVAATSAAGVALNACDPDHYYGQTPSISIVKLTNGTDNNAAPGVYVAAGSTVTWTYNVTNTGNVTLTDVAITDDKVGAICVIPSLAPGASDSCTKTGTALEGQYVNMGTVTGKPPVGPEVTDEDPDHYYGQTPGISIVKKTNGTDNNAAPGVYVAVGSTVTWTYDITNTGNVTLTNVNVVDDKVGAICTIASLAAGASQTCTKTGTALEGQYVNMGT